MDTYETLLRLGLKTDVPLRAGFLRRHAIFSGGCPDCGERLTEKKFCNGCKRDQLKELNA